MTRHLNARAGLGGPLATKHLMQSAVTSNMICLVKKEQQNLSGMPCSAGIIISCFGPILRVEGKLWGVMVLNYPLKYSSSAARKDAILRNAWVGIAAVEWMVTCVMWEKATVTPTQTARLVLSVEQVEVVHKCLGQILNPMTNVA